MAITMNLSQVTQTNKGESKIKVVCDISGISYYTDYVDVMVYSPQGWETTQRITTNGTQTVILDVTNFGWYKVNLQSSDGKTSPTFTIVLYVCTLNSSVYTDYYQFTSADQVNFDLGKELAMYLLALGITKAVTHKLSFKKAVNGFIENTVAFTAGLLLVYGTQVSTSINVPIKIGHKTRIRLLQLSDRVSVYREYYGDNGTLVASENVMDDILATF